MLPPSLWVIMTVMAKDILIVQMSKLRLMTSKHMTAEGTLPPRFLDSMYSLSELCLAHAHTYLLKEECSQPGYPLTEAAPYPLRTGLPMAFGLRVSS